MNDFQKESVPLLGSMVVSSNDEYSYDGLSTAQLRAVRARLPTVVPGAAGTGKTTVILHRIAKATTDENIGLSNIFICSPTPKTSQKIVTNLQQLINDVPEYTDTIYGNAIRLLETYPALLTVHGYTKDFELIDDITFNVLLAETLKPHAKYLHTKFAISRPKAKKNLRAGIKSLKSKGFYSIDLHESPAQVSEDNILLLTDAFQEIPADIAFETYEVLKVVGD